MRKINTLYLYLHTTTQLMNKDNNIHIILTPSDFVSVLI